MSLLVDIRKDLGAFRLDVRFAAEDECLALLGASGCGKSVTLQCIAGILRPDEGRIVLDGETLFDSEQRIDLPPQRRRVGYLFQQYALFPNMSVRQNIAAAVREKQGRDETVAELLRRFHLEDAADARPGRLSGGQQQRTALARILASRPRTILLDEPLSALDSYLRFELELELQTTLAAFPGTALWVTHDRGEAWRSCPRVCVLSRGKSEPVVPMETLFRSPVTESAARLSGCKNYAAAEALGRCVRLPGWNVTLDCGRAVPSETRTVGIRSHHVRPASDTAKNRISCAVERVIDDVFGVIVLLRPVNAAPDAPALRMELSKEVWAAQGDKALLTVTVSPQDILLLQ